MTAPNAPRPFGQAPDGQPFHLVELGDIGDGLAIGVTDVGATLVTAVVPDARGRPSDVTLGYDAGTDYLDDRNPYLGATVGRVANRIAQARFSLDGREHRLLANEGAHHLHGGGPRALSWHVWQLAEATRDRATFATTSPDGEEGYPGTLEARATYEVDGPTLTIRYRAITDAPTPVSLTSHGYWNLEGHDHGDVRAHLVQVDADAFTATDGDNVPTGAVVEVVGTALDLRTDAVVGDRLATLAEPDEPHGPTLDHNLVLARGPRPLTRVARVVAPGSGRTLTLSTTEPGLQVYAGAGIPEGLAGKGGVAYGPFGGLCLEPQGWPDAINQPGFPSPVLRPGATYEHVTQLTFGTG